MSRPTVEWCLEHKKHEPIPACDPEEYSDHEYFDLPGEEIKRYPGELYD